MSTWNEVCQISNLPIWEEEECYVFLIETVNATQKIPISSGMGSKYRFVCSPLTGNYDGLGGLTNCEDKYGVFDIFKNKSQSLSDDFSDISAKLFSSDKYHLVWVKKELFDALKEKDYIKKEVEYEFKGINIDLNRLREIPKEDTNYLNSRAEMLASYINISPKYIIELLSKGEEEFLVLFSLLIMLRKLRKNLAPAMATTDELCDIYKDVAKYIMINF